MIAARTQTALGALILGATAIALLSPGPVLAGAVIALLAGAALLTLAPADGPLFADVISHLPAPRQRAAARAVVVLTAPLAGLGPALYAAAAFAVAVQARPERRRTVDWRTAAGTGLVGLGTVVGADAAGVAVGDGGLLWCVLLLSAGLPLFWSTRLARGEAPLADPRVITLLGAVLLLGGTGVILDRVGSVGIDAGAIVGTLAVLFVVAFVFVPRWLRTQRQLNAERRRREREQERAEIGEMLHDSVLQTLALIQRREDTPAPIAALARRQERELRDWLLRGEAPAHAAATLDEGLRAIVAAIEDDHDVAVETVTVGDTPLSPAIEALLAAAREALLNAVKYGAGSPISVFAKVADGTADIFVRDRGPGFDVDAIDPERRGVRVSILARMERAGGYAEVVTAPGDGCEVMLEMPV